MLRVLHEDTKIWKGFQSLNFGVEAEGVEGYSKYSDIYLWRGARLFGTVADISRQS